MNPYMTFSEALEALNNGLFVARKGWNGKGMFLYKVEASDVTYEQLRGRCKDAIKYVFEHAKDDEPQTVQETVQETVHINAHIDMKAADDSIVVGWLASQTDMQANDWYIVKEAD